MKKYFLLAITFLSLIDLSNAQTRQDEFTKFKEKVLATAKASGWHWHRTTYFSYKTGSKEVIQDLNPNMWVRIVFIQDMDCWLKFGVKEINGGGVSGLEKDEVKRVEGFLYNTLSFVTKDQKLNFWIKSEGPCIDVAGNACMMILYKTKEEALRD